MTDTPRTDAVREPIDGRRDLRGFYMPEDIIDLTVLAKLLEGELAERGRSLSMGSPTPEGWKLVPIEPTSTMIEAATPKEWIGHPEAREESRARWFESYRKAAREHYAAMLAAAPQHTPDAGIAPDDELRAAWWKLRGDVDDARDVIGRFLIDRAEKHDLRQLHARLSQPQAVQPIAPADAREAPVCEVCKNWAGLLTAAPCPVCDGKRDAVPIAQRSPSDYAIEHAGYLADSAKRLLDHITLVHMAKEALDLRPDEAAFVELNERLESCQDALSESMSDVRENIYEFEKRRDRARISPAHGKDHHE